MSPNPLETLIRRQIARAGAMTFRDFMALALYHPEHGYYASGRARIGRKGDFFTNVSVGALFGQLLAEQFREMWMRLGQNGQKQSFTVVEQGAAGGEFARDVLAWTQNVAPDFFDALRYVIVEPFQKMRERQAATLGEFAERVGWRQALEQIEPFCGVHFSNELLDAFPVHLVRFEKNQWRERGISAEFQWLDLPIENAELSAHTELLPKIEGYTTEINLDALAWCDQISAKLQRGWVLAIDYGYPRALYYAPERTGGTLSCYAAHTRNFNPLQNPGAQDITAHVDFTSLAERAEKNGLRVSGFTDQHHFIVALAADFFTQRPPDAKQSRALQMLMHPQFLGAVFKVLALEKNTGAGAPMPTPLRGFAFSSNAKTALG